MAESAQDRQALGEVLLQMAEAELNVDLAREILAQKRDLNVTALFGRLVRGDGVTLLQVKDFLEANGTKTDSLAAELLFNSLDRDRDGVLSWPEFIRGCVDRMANPDSFRGQQWREREPISPGCEAALAMVLKQELTVSQQIEELKLQTIGDLRQEELLQLFDLVDLDNKGWITLVDLWNFLKIVAPGVPLRIAERCFRRLDLNYDLRITEDEWLRNLRPYNRGYRQTTPNRMGNSAGPSPGLAPPTSNDSRLTDLGRSNNKLGQTMRSTAEKTFSESKFAGAKSQQDTSRSPTKQVTTEVFNYYEDDVPVEKEVTTKVTRAYRINPEYYDEINNSKIKRTAEERLTQTSQKVTPPSQQRTYRFEDHQDNQPEPQDIQLRESRPEQNSGSKISYQPASFQLNKNSTEEHPSFHGLPREPIYIQFTSPHETRHTTQSDEALQDSLKKPTASPAVRSQLLHETVYIDHPEEGAPMAPRGFAQPKPREDSQSSNRRGRNSSRSREVSESYLSRNKGESRRFVKPKSKAPLERAAKKGIDDDVLEKFERLKKKRGEMMITLERNATRGVLNSDEPDQMALKKKPLTDVPTRYVPEGWERMLENQNKSEYEELVINRSMAKYHTENMPYHEANSYSPYDISEGRTYTRPPVGYTSVAPQDFSERQRLVAILAEIIRDFRIVEQKKSNLAMRYDLRLKELFELADLSKSASISVHDFAAMMEDVGLQFTFEEAFKVFSVYDSDRDRYLNFEDFAELFLPFNCEFRDALCAKSTRKVFEYSQFQRDTLKAIKDCLASLVNVELNLILYKQQLRGSEQALFDLLDQKGSNCLCLEDFLTLLARHGYNVSPMEVSAFIRRLDSNRDGELSREEWKAGLSPDSVSEYRDMYMQTRAGQKPSSLVINPPETIYTTNIRTTEVDCSCRLIPCHCCHVRRPLSSRTVETTVYSPAKADSALEDTMVETEMHSTYSERSYRARRHRKTSVEYQY